MALAAPPGTSIELAARGSDGSVPSVLERASVRTKAAYFEALIHSNTTAHIVCSADGAQHCHNFGCPPGADDEGDEAAVDGWLQDAGAASSSAGYSEVHMILRMPRAAPPQQVQPAAGPYGTAEEMEALIEQLRGELSLKEQQRQAAVEAYMRRTREVSNLQRVVQELTESRKQAVMKAASLSERYSELQAEYHRSLRIADLSRSVSKENMAKTSRTRTELRRVQLELHTTKSHASRMSEKEKKARLENALLKEKVTLLERLDFEQVQESECKKVFTRYRLAETY